MDTDGFTMLAAYDSNGDGRINASDAVFDDLLVWTDVNSDGVSQSSELHSLADYDIASISLDAERLGNTEIAGNEITHEATYTMTDGTERSIVDAWFSFDPYYAKNIDDYTFDIRTAFLPTLKGFGDLKDLYVAASKDNDETDPDSLMSRLTDISEGMTFAGAITDWDGTYAEVEAILLRWAGVDDVDPNGRGLFVDGRHLAFNEAFRGEPFDQYGRM